MPIADFYRLKEPSEWAPAPEILSYSSLTAIKQCPLQWQLAHSKYGENLEPYPFRPTPSSIEGSIVHTVMEILFRSLSFQGLPKVGSQEFRECVRDVGIKDRVESLVREHANRIVAHPRGNGFRLRLTAQQLTNKVIRIFRQQYSDLVANEIPLPSSPNAACKVPEVHTGQLSDLLQKYGVLSEYQLKHPELPFVGIMDLVFLEDRHAVIVDFKTGRKDECHLKQLMYYSVLWWRNADQRPGRIEVHYPSGSLSQCLTDNDLENAEKELKQEIDRCIGALSERPASSIMGEHCSYCDVRQFCQDYWLAARLSFIDNSNKNTTIDLEATISEEPGKYGFQAETSASEGISIVFEPNVALIHSPFIKGEKLRILAAFHKGGSSEIELKSWSEIFRV